MGAVATAGLTRPPIYFEIRVWGFACKRVGVQCSLYEGTKHSLGTALKAAGVEDRVIQQLFGHTDIRSLQAYARIEDATLRKAMARLHVAGSSTEPSN